MGRSLLLLSQCVLGVRIWCGIFWFASGRTVLLVLFICPILLCTIFQKSISVNSILLHFLLIFHASLLHFLGWRCILCLFSLNMYWYHNSLCRSDTTFLSWYFTPSLDNFVQISLQWYFYLWITNYILWYVQFVALFLVSIPSVSHQYTYNILGLAQDISSPTFRIHPYICESYIRDSVCYWYSYIFTFSFPRF